MHNETLASEIIAELQEKVGVLEEREALKAKCIQNILSIEDNLTLHYLALITDLLKRNRAEVGGADAYISVAFFHLMELFEQKPDEKIAKLICEVIQSLRREGKKLCQKKDVTVKDVF